jgi:hypothetical protein
MYVWKLGRLSAFITVVISPTYVGRTAKYTVRDAISGLHRWQPVQGLNSQTLVSEGDAMTSSSTVRQRVFHHCEPDGNDVELSQNLRPPIPKDWNLLYILLSMAVNWDTSCDFGSVPCVEHGWEQWDFDDHSTTEMFHPCKKLNLYPVFKPGKRKSWFMDVFLIRTFIPCRDFPAGHVWWLWKCICFLCGWGRRPGM